MFNSIQNEENMQMGDQFTNDKFVGRNGAN